MSALVFGASAGLGRALARELASRGENLVLVARNPEDLAAEAAHLRTVYGATVEWMALDASDPRATEELTELAGAAAIRDLFFPIGMGIEEDDGSLPPATIAALVSANLTSVMAAVSLFLPRLLAANVGNIIGIGSVAALRGRSRNVAYAAAKRGLESYFESLRHRTAASGVRVQFYRLGYLDTQMSFGRHLPFPKASVQAIACTVMRNLGKDVGCMPLPAFWRPVGWALRALPWRIYRRLNF
ncbi:MAG TPA: SDR family NAD(P)-dependent oxidoreductase [Stellaceae bacterium]|nr:SDR family NAD(P)-dependent oxidoreductase [Stellaceae bacterium]